MNIYKHQFIVACPNNGERIVYQLRIETERMIPVEHIVTATQLIGEDFHEAIADRLHKQFGGRQIITAHHHGVDIETQRGGRFARLRSVLCMLGAHRGATVYDDESETETFLCQRCDYRRVRDVSHWNGICG